MPPKRVSKREAAESTLADVGAGELQAQGTPNRWWMLKEDKELKDVTIMNLDKTLILQNTQLGQRHLLQRSDAVWYTNIFLANMESAKVTQEAKDQYAEIVKGWSGTHTMGMRYVAPLWQRDLNIVNLVNEGHAQRRGYHKTSQQGRRQILVSASVKFFKNKAICKELDEKKLHLVMANMKLMADLEELVITLKLTLLHGELERLVKARLEKIKKKQPQIRSWH